MGNVLLSLIALPALEEVAAVLYPPAYISLESALFMHGVRESGFRLHLSSASEWNRAFPKRMELGKSG